MKGMRFNRNRQNTCSFGKFLEGNPTRPPPPVAYADIVVPRSPRSVLFEIEMPCILLFLNRNKNSQNGPKRMHP